MGKVTKAKKVNATAKVAKTEVKKTRVARAVSFTITTVNKKRSFTPVNKRAKAFALIAGEGKLTTKHLKAIKALGFRVVDSGADLAVITL